MKGINDVLDQWTEGRMLHAANHGLLSFGSEDAGAVSEIILVLGRYWMDFSHKKYPEAAGADLRHKGISHIFSLCSSPISLRRQHSSLNGDFNKDKNPAVFHIFLGDGMEARLAVVFGAELCSAFGHHHGASFGTRSQLETGYRAHGGSKPARGDGDIFHPRIDERPDVP